MISQKHQCFDSVMSTFASLEASNTSDMKNLMTPYPMQRCQNSVLFFILQMYYEQLQIQMYIQIALIGNYIVDIRCRCTISMISMPQFQNETNH